MPSFEQINYMLRPNKVVERKLIFDILANLGRALDISSYTYIGLGSMWFVDFIMAHRLIAIDKLISIEGRAPDRAAFNAPYKCIEVKGGNSTDVLPNLDYSSRIVAWMDYDQGLNPSVVDDFEILCRQCQSGSVLLLTVNAHIGQIRDQRDANNNPLTRAEAFQRAIRNFGDPSLKESDLSTKKYPTTLSKTLKAVFEHLVHRRGDDLKYIQIFDFQYEDGAPMITVGGIVADDAIENTVSNVKAQANLDFLAPTAPYEISVPPLTHREKIAIDRLLPSTAIPEIKEQLGFEIPAKQLSQYHRFYLHYPVFAEILF